MFRRFNQTASQTFAGIPSFFQKLQSPNSPTTAFVSPHQHFASMTPSPPSPPSPLYTISTALASTTVGLTAYHLYHQPTSQPPNASTSTLPFPPLPHHLAPHPPHQPSPFSPFLNQFHSTASILASTIDLNDSIQPLSSEDSDLAAPLPPAHPSHLLPSPNSNPFLQPTQSEQSPFTSLPNIPALNRIDSKYLDMTSFLFFSLIGLLGVRVMLYPLNVIKTRLQATTPVPSPMPMFQSLTEQSLSEQQSPVTQQKKLSARTVFLDIIKNEGLRPLFAGLGLSLGLTVSRQLYFYMYEHLRSFLVHINASNSFIESESLFNLTKDSLAAFVATALYQIVANPLDIIVQRLMTHRRAVEKVSNLHMVEETTASKAEQMANTFDPFAVPEAPKPKSAIMQQLVDRFAALKLTRNLFHADPAVFYRGFTSSTVLWSFNSMIWWGSFEMLLQQLSSFFPKSTPKHSQTIHLFDQFLCDDSQNLLHSHSWYAQHVAAALSSWLSVVLTHPLDTARTRLMVNCRKNDGMTATSAILNTLREEGFKGLWCGLSARTMLVVPTSVLTMTVYQISKVFSIEIRFRNGQLTPHENGQGASGYQHTVDPTAGSDTPQHTPLHQLKGDQASSMLQRKPTGEYFLPTKYSSSGLHDPTNPIVALISQTLTAPYLKSPLPPQLQMELSKPMQLPPHLRINQPHHRGPHKVQLKGDNSSLQLPNYIEFRLVSQPIPQQGALLLDMTVPASTTNSLNHSSQPQPSGSTTNNNQEREQQTREVMSLFQQIHDLVGKLGYRIEVLDAGDGEPDDQGEIDEEALDPPTQSPPPQGPTSK